jgi:hypothetical protein
MPTLLRCGMRPPNPGKRSAPASDILEWRQDYLTRLAALSASQPAGHEPPSLELGNRKTGRTGSRFATVLVWNLPAAASCPGASAWCRTHCYNADPRPDVFPVGRWLENWAWVVHAPERLRENILRQLEEATPPVAVRVHSSGDFFTAAYAEFWRHVSQLTPRVSYWAYTRSWTNPEIRAALDDLRAEPNFQLFASWDATMPPPPAGWRLAFVGTRTSAESISFMTHRGPSLSCPEEREKGPACASCGYCIAPQQGNVTFEPH